MINGKIKQLQGEIEHKQGQLAGRDIIEAEESLRKLIGRMRERSGDQREVIEWRFK